VPYAKFHVSISATNGFPHGSKTAGHLKGHQASVAAATFDSFPRCSLSVRLVNGGDEAQFPASLVDAQHQALEGHGDWGKCLRRSGPQISPTAERLERVRNASHVAALNFIQSLTTVTFRNPAVGAIAENLDRALREAQQTVQEGI
jgi:hypothetical protein